jgi:hypothetical protein
MKRRLGFQPVLDPATLNESEDLAQTTRAKSNDDYMKRLELLRNKRSLEQK